MLVIYRLWENAWLNQEEVLDNTPIQFGMKLVAAYNSLITLLKISHPYWARGVWRVLSSPTDTLDSNPTRPTFLCSCCPLYEEALGMAVPPSKG
jgi:hypothetical protein